MKNRDAPPSGAYISIAWHKASYVMTFVFGQGEHRSNFPLIEVLGSRLQSLRVCHAYDFFEHDDRFAVALHFFTGVEEHARRVCNGFAQIITDLTGVVTNLVMMMDLSKERPA